MNADAIEHDDVRILTVRQPWATAIAEGLKRFETRTKPTKWRGWVFIHAAKAMTREQHQLAFNMGPRESELPRGRVVAIANLRASWRTVDIDLANFGKGISADERALGDYTAGRYAWQLDDVHAFDGPPLVGKLGLWIPNARQRAQIFASYRKSLTP